jgi:hypothetical protein
MNHKKNQPTQTDPNNAFLHTGDIIHVFQNTFLGSLRKFITRKSFTATGIYLDINGLGMVIVNFKGRVLMMRLDEFLVYANQTFIKTSVVFPDGYMKRILQTLGKKKDTSHLVAELLDESHGQRFNHDELYKHLNKKDGI